MIKRLNIFLFCVLAGAFQVQAFTAYENFISSDKIKHTALIAAAKEGKQKALNKALLQLKNKKL